MGQLPPEGAGAPISWSPLAGVGISGLSGDVTAGPGGGVLAATLAASGVVAGTYAAGMVTVDAKGRVTAALAAVPGLLDLSAALAGQVKFPATQNAASNANTLDDYERGSWTPVIGGLGGTSGQTYSVQAGNYLRIGQLVIAAFQATFSAKGTITGSAVITGLPYVVLALSAGNPFLGTIGWQATVSLFVNAHAVASGGVAFAPLYGTTLAAVTNFTDMVTADFGNTTSLRGCLVYLGA